METLTATAAAGLRARMESLDMLANNVANADTGGYKADREFYSLYVAPEAQDTDPASVMPLVQRHWTDYSQGTLRPTGNPLDLAISGKGFFAVNGPTGPLYTRNGNLRLAPDGTLVTSEGYPLRVARGASLTVQPSTPIQVARDGTVYQDGNVIGQLEIADFTSTAGLSKQGNNYFRVSDPTAQPATPAQVSVEQGKLEGSNTGTAEAAVRLISVMRQFEMLHKAVSIGNEMDKSAMQEVAKVGS